MRKILLVLGVCVMLFAFSGGVLAFDGYSNPIRVHLADAGQGVTVSVLYSSYEVRDSSGAVVAKMNQGESVTLSAGQTLSSVNGFGRFAYSGKEYRGDLTHTGKYLVNKLPLEWYLYSVVNMEIGGNAPLEALKAQAVASRGYACIKLKNPRNKDFDVVSTTSDQAYGGYSGENYSTGKNIRAACDNTKALVCYYEGKLANTIYCDNTGGYTEDAEMVWGGSYPYMKSIVNPYDSLAYVGENITSSGSTYKVVKLPQGYQWARTFTFDEVAQKVGGIGSLTSVNISNLKSGYVKDITFVGTSGQKSYSGEEVRSVLDLRSGNFSIMIGKSVGASKTFSLQYLDTANFNQFLTGNSNVVTFEGRGYGHSVGMSQWGACVMASKGFTYQQILNYYYNQNQNNGKLTIEVYR